MLRGPVNLLQSPSFVHHGQHEDGGYEDHRAAENGEHCVELRAETCHINYMLR